jgi:hypothetical protein
MSRTCACRITQFVIKDEEESRILDSIGNTSPDFVCPLQSSFEIVRIWLLYFECKLILSDYNTIFQNNLHHLLGCNIIVVFDLSTNCIEIECKN